MPQHVESNLSNEEVQLIKLHQLGDPLDIYRQKPNYIRLFRSLNLILLVFGVITLLLFVIIMLKNWFLSLTVQQGNLHELSAILHQQAIQQQVESTYYFAIPSFCICMILCLLGLFYTRNEFVRAKSAHIIVCQYGFLVIEKRIRANQIEVIYWKDIPTIIGKGIIPKEYAIKYREDKELPLRGFYQDIDNFIELVMQKTREV